MRLKELIESLEDYKVNLLLEDFEVGGISCNSRSVSENFIFVAIKGTHNDGHCFISEAVDRGAKAVILQALDCNLQYKQKVSIIAVRDTRKSLAKLVTVFYGNPSQKIKVVGITGTNGKTTVSYLIEAVLKEAGFLPAVIGTINYRFKDRIIPAKNTTPGPIELQSLLAEMSREDLNYAIMEVSSHALTQDRTEGIDFHSAIFTNLTWDHLDYHINRENYFQAKAKLFIKINPHCLVIINNDDAYAGRLKALTKAKIITYGIEKQADIVAKDIKFDITHSEFSLVTQAGKADLKTNLIGFHNVYNALAACAWALSEGIDLSIIKSALQKFCLVPGRLERIDFTGDFFVFIDYAHTEDALRNVLKALRQLTKNRLIVVFGCGGERDRIKRPQMGNVATELADLAIITNDNPRSEAPQEIIEDIKKGIRKENFCIILERFEAISQALSIAKSGDVVLIAGRGHENYQILKDRQVHFDDREVVRECLRSMSYSR